MIRAFSTSIFLGLFAFGLNQNLLSQAPTNVFSNITVSSPNAASLGKYGDYPVSYNTGLPQISIPFYTVKEGSLSLPISISYHASGLKVTEASSWVGAGWALNAGGAVTRTVVGAPDDRGSLTNTQYGHFSNYGYNSYIFDSPGGGASPSCYDFPEDNLAHFVDAWFETGERDGEPDLFFFNFCGYSGKFYFRDDRTPVLVPEADFKIEPVTINVAENIIGFVITASDGTKYYFGKNQNGDGNIDAVETTYPFTSENGLTSGAVYSAWYLNKIVSSDNQFSIVLTYQTEDYSDYAISLFPVAYSDIDNIHCKLVKNYIDGVRLNQINFSNGNVKFSAVGVRTDLGQYAVKTMDDMVNTDAKSLDTVKITDNNNYCKNYILYHSYFQDNTTGLSSKLTGLTINTDKKRLRLDSIVEKTCDNSLKIPPYTFTYTVPSGSFAPRRLSFGQDHWGYYNGKVYNQGLIPTYTLNIYESYPGADRDSKWPEMSYGSLNKITYPTGGYTQFTFEANDVWANYTYYSDVQVGSSLNIGPFIGTLSDQPINFTASANHYRWILDFHTDAGSTSAGVASITPLGTVYANRTAPHGEFVFVPGAGPKTYNLHQVDMTNTYHDWATARLYEIVPTNYLNNKIIGGLRIKSIINNNGTANDSATYFNYRSGSQSTGVLYSRPVYLRILRNDMLNQVGFATAPAATLNGCIYGLPNGTGTSYQKSPSSLRPMETVQGNHIGYNMVEVTRTGNGKIRYQYYGSNIWDNNFNDVCTRDLTTGGCPLSSPNYPDAPLPFEFKRGELKYTATFNQANNLLNDAFYYPEFTTNPVTTPAYKNGNYTGVHTLYNLSTSKKTRNVVVASEYPLTGGTITKIDTVFYESPYHTQATRTVTINSKNERIETKTKYAFDFRVPNCEAISDCWQAYSTGYTNALNTFNYTINTCSNSGGCNCKWPAYQSYRYSWAVARKNYISCRRTNFTNATNAFKTAHDNAKATADAELKPVLELHDKYINAPIETTTWKNGKLFVASYVKYDYATNPTGNVYPSKQQEIKLFVPSTTFTVASSSNTTITKDSRYKDEAIIKFEGGVVTELQKKDGIQAAYIWDYAKNFPVATVVAAGPADIAYTSFETAGNTGNFTSNTPRYPDAAAPAGKQCYSIGNGPVQRTGLNSSKSYILSYWQKNGASITVSAGTQSNNLTGPTRNSWVYKQLQFTGTPSATISGTGFIDEIRIYPVGAQMSTYTYSPLVGMTSAADVNNKITYYDFDKLGRLKNIKDHNKDITKSFFYNYGAAPSAVPAMANVSVVILESVAGITVTAQLTSKTTGQVFTVTNAASVNVPTDTYDIYVSYSPYSSPALYQVCSSSVSGATATFYNIAVTASSCNVISITQ